MLYANKRSRTEGTLRSISKFNAAFGLLLRVGDLAILGGAAWLAYFLRFDHWELPVAYWRLVVTAILLALLILNGSNLYRSWRGMGVSAEAVKLVWQWTVLFVALLVYVAALKLAPGGTSRIWAMSWYALSLGSALLLRVGVRKTANWVRMQGMDMRSAVIVGANPDAQRLIDALHRNSWAGINLRGWFVTHADRSQLHGAPMLGDLDKLGDYVATNNIDQVWLALPMREQAKISYALSQLEHSIADVKLLPDLFGMRLLNHSVDSVAGLPVINLRSSPLDGNATLVKMLEDKILATLILLLISPLMIAIAIAVKLSSPGPVIFKQLRHGLDGKPISVWKFRSMRLHAETAGHVTQATKGDPRITKLGAFLRKSSLDELPQFINVLQGSMSIVGPRPHAIAHNEQYKTLIDRYMQRHRVKPGITGWAQVNGLRGETDTVEKMAKRVKYDLFYLQNWSLGFDLRIIFMTIFKGFFNKNAY